MNRDLVLGILVGLLASSMLWFVVGGLVPWLSDRAVQQAPEAAVEAWLDAMRRGEVDTAADHSTPALRDRILADRDRVLRVVADPRGEWRADLPVADGVGGQAPRGPAAVMTFAIVRAQMQGEGRAEVVVDLTRGGATVRRAFELAAAPSGWLVERWQNLPNG